MPSTLFVAGFNTRTRAADLAFEFERYGRLVRCDIPAPKTLSSKPYAFVEYEDPRDAEDAFNEMHGRRIDAYTISVQWARNAPSASWRYHGQQQQQQQQQQRRQRRSLSPPLYSTLSPRDEKEMIHPDDYRYYSYHHRSAPPPPFPYVRGRSRSPPPPSYRYPPPMMHYRYRRPDSPRQRYYSRSPPPPLPLPPTSSSPPRYPSSVASSPSQSKYDRYPSPPGYHQRPYSPQDHLSSSSPPPPRSLEQRSPSPPILEY